MSAPFEALEDRLLRGGIAPRHVRRYLRELSEHLADLTEAERQAGFGEAEAAARARAALGTDQELADAMLKQRDFRSFSARFPWAVFLLAPPVATLVALLLPCLLLLLVMVTGGATLGLHGGMPEPGWFKAAARAFVAANNLLIGPMVVALFVLIAHRQRLRPLWPALTVAVMLLVWLRLNVTFGDAGPADPTVMSAHYRTRPQASSLGVGLMPLFLPQAWPRIAAAWPLFAAQYLLTLAPLAWLLHTRRKTAAP